MLPVSSTLANRYPVSQVCLYGGSYYDLHHKKVKCVMENDVVSFKTPPTPFNLQNTTFLATNIPDAYSLKPAANDVFGGINDSLSALVCNTDTAITNTLNSINTSLKLASKAVNDALDVSLDKLKVSFSSALSGLGNNSKGVGVVAVDGLRHTIIAVEGVLAQGVTLVAYGYGYVKDTLPPEAQNVLNSSEENVFRPVGTAFQQIYVVLEGFEASIGIDPSDPIVPVVLLLATSTTLWVSYWVLTYAGYAGDLSPQLTLELLNGKENVALIDVRPEARDYVDFREKDGIPDLRRKARFRYASVSFPEVDANVKKLLKGGKDLDDALVSTVIRNLKVVQGGSKVIVMDADGSRSKGIARALRKFGIKRPYLVQGGFRSWVQEGLRIKEPKPETTLTILNEEAEAILEDVTPLQVIGYGVGFLAAAYALLEWETTLQLIAIFGVGQTIYKRVASYEDSKDLNRDVRQLLAPVKLGGQAISWAAGKWETNRNGLPTSPSSVNVNVQNRVLQAAAKHESQPDSEEEATSSVNQSPPPDLSEA
ncbi:putative Rhodanese-like domain-containing protein [Helianthus anomalus]